MFDGVYIIAEVGSVHDGSFGNAVKLIELASQCGANAVKFQTHIAEAETLKEAPSPSYFQTEPRYDYFQRTGFSTSQWKELREQADEQNIDFISSPFSNEAVELLENIGVTCFKIPSGEVTNEPMLELIAETKKPTFISSGMSNWEELDKAIKVFENKSCPVSVLQCSSLYPCPHDSVGLNVLAEMSRRWQKPVGFSDHTLENYACFAAVSLGAVVIEKHLTFSRAMYGSDARHSAEPDQFKELVQGIRAITIMRENNVDKNDLKKFKNMKAIFEKSIVSKTAIKAGSVITSDMLGAKKPGTGLSTSQTNNIIGKKAIVDIPKDALISLSHFGS